MNWKINGAEYPVIRLGLLLGGLSGLTASALGMLFRQSPETVLWLGVTFGLVGFLALIVLFLADTTLSGLVEGETRRARLRAARRIFQEWAEGTLEPPAEVHTSTYRVGGEVRKLDWISDDDPEAWKWRRLLAHLFQFARAYHRESKGARTGLTEADMVGEGSGKMFPRRDGYLKAMKIAKDLGLVTRENGQSTRLAEGWTYTKAITYIQTAAVLPPIKEKSPDHRHYTGVRG